MISRFDWIKDYMLRHPSEINLITYQWSTCNKENGLSSFVIFKEKKKEMIVISFLNDNNYYIQIVWNSEISYQIYSLIIIIIWNFGYSRHRYTMA